MYSLQELLEQEYLLALFSGRAGGQYPRVAVELFIEASPPTQPTGVRLEYVPPYGRGGVTSPGPLTAHDRLTVYCFGLDYGDEDIRFLPDDLGLPPKEADFVSSRKAKAGAAPYDGIAGSPPGCIVGPLSWGDIELVRQTLYRHYNRPPTGRVFYFPECGHLTRRDYACALDADWWRPNRPWGAE